MNLKTLLAAGLLGLTSLIIAALLAYLTRWQTAMISLIPFLCGLTGFVLILLALLARGLAKARKAGGLGRAGQILLMAGFFLLLQLAYLPLSQRLRRQEVVRRRHLLRHWSPRWRLTKRSKAFIQKRLRPF